MLVAAPTSSSLSVMTTDDSMSDDVFESPEDATMTESGGGGGGGGVGKQMNVMSVPGQQTQQLKTPSPTGYRDYKPPADLLKLYEEQQDEAEQLVHKTILLGDSGVGKTSLLVQFDTGKFQTGTFSATVGIGFTVSKDSPVSRYYATLTACIVGSVMADVHQQQVRRVVTRPSWSLQQQPHPSQANGSAAVNAVRRDSAPQRQPLRPVEPCDLTCKVMLLGDSGVGKTCLLVRFRDGLFLSGNFISTVGIDFRNKVVTVDQSKVKLQIWDTAGQERFRSVTHAYYRDAHALLLLYDVTNKTSFDNIRAWLGEIREYAQDDVVIMLLGNKADCGSERLVRKEDGERLAREYNVAFMETSAKTGLNVELTFMAVARELKSRKSGNSDETRFNVQDYVREQSQRGSCPPCNT